jgi:hypothetical protein
MNSIDVEWLRTGSGNKPRLSWSFATEAPLAALKQARETGEVLAADTVGGIYHFARDGQLIGLTHGPSPLRGLGWSDTGAGGVALVGDRRLCWFDRQLAFQGSAELAASGTALAMESHGHYVAAARDDCATAIYDTRYKFLRKYAVLQPLMALEFLLHTPAIVGITSYGMLCCHSFSGEQLWQEKLITAGGKLILLACFNVGIQCHDEKGLQVGSYQLGGTVSRIASSYHAGRIAAATVEGHFYWIDQSGRVEWQSSLPEPICQMACDPRGAGVTCGFQSGRIVRLDW